ncbi:MULTISPECIES: LCP family protein [unclassified Terrabacter]|uniref:LCP family protein n=1 Tax=unclassified Terrabacter TaxID=2630222 RepID=UPI0006F31B88|nr:MULTISPECIES: LCP family protein [unclassified Terrabacter]KRB46291.1 transcriptional regulator [Terrabacter sp. Root181]KRF46631.1 transcriptional regulator [Terrabacter sp. Soil810]
MTYPNARGPAAPPTREALRRELKSGFRRAVGLTALGTVVPGAGLTQTRSRKFGWLLIALAVVSLSVGAYYVMKTGVTNTALSIVARPTVLQSLAVAFVVGGILWCGSIILTAVQSRPTRLDRTRTRLLAGFTTLMVFLVAGSSFKVAEYATITQSTVAQVFGKTPTTPGAGAQVSEGEDPWADQARVNILLLGSDAGADRIGIRTDSMILASIDTKTGRTALVSMPRNLLNAPLAPKSPLRAIYPSGKFGSPDSSCDQGAGQCMLTNLYVDAENYAKAHPGAYPVGDQPGRVELRGAVQEITGLEVDQMVVIDLKGFSRLIDAMGGLDINVKRSGYGTKLTIGGEHAPDGRIVGVKGYFEPGRQHLDGYHSLWYARTRAADSDTFRQMRQRCVVQAIVQQVNPAQMVTKYPEVASILKDNIYTDIPVQNLPAFVELVERVQKSKIASVALTQKQGVYSNDPDYDLIRELVQKGIAPPKATPKPSSTSSPTSTPTKTKTPSTSSTDSYETC